METNEKIQLIIDLCIEIYACGEEDWDVVIDGNSCDAYRMLALAKKILYILDVKDNEKFRKLISNKIKKYKEEYDW